MHGYFLKNSNGEFLETLDTANEKITFTKNVKKARNYIGRPGGGRWDADNEREFIIFHFQDEYKDKVTTLECTYEEWDE